MKWFETLETITKINLCNKFCQIIYYIYCNYLYLDIFYLYIYTYFYCYVSSSLEENSMSSYNNRLLLRESGEAEHIARMGVEEFIVRALGNANFVSFLLCQNPGSLLTTTFKSFILSESPSMVSCFNFCVACCNFFDQWKDNTDYTSVEIFVKELAHSYLDIESSINRASYIPLAASSRLAVMAAVQNFSDAVSSSQHFNKTVKPDSAAFNSSTTQATATEGISPAQEMKSLLVQLEVCFYEIGTLLDKLFRKFVRCKKFASWRRYHQGYAPAWGMSYLYSVADRSASASAETDVDGLVVEPLSVLAEGDEESVHSGSASKKTNSKHSNSNHSLNSCETDGENKSNKASTMSPTIEEHRRCGDGVENRDDEKAILSNSKIASQCSFDSLSGLAKMKNVENSTPVTGGSAKKRRNSDKSTVMNTVRTMSSVSDLTYTGSASSSKYSMDYTPGSSNISKSGIDYQSIYSLIETSCLEKLMSFDSKWLIILLTGMENVPVPFAVYEDVVIDGVTTRRCLYVNRTSEELSNILRKDLINAPFGIDLENVPTDDNLCSTPVRTRNVHIGDGDSIKNVFCSDVSAPIDSITIDKTIKTVVSDSPTASNPPSGTLSREQSSEIVSFDSIFCSDLRIINKWMDISTGGAPLIAGSKIVELGTPVIVGFKAIDVRMKPGDSESKAKYFITLQTEVCVCIAKDLDILVIHLTW